MYVSSNVHLTKESENLKQHYIYIREQQYDTLFSVIVRQLEQQVKTILDSIAVSEERKKELIRGDAVDKAEQLSESYDYHNTLLIFA